MITLSDLPQNIIYEPSLEFSTFVSACVKDSNFGIPYMSVEVEKALSNLNAKKQLAWMTYLPVF